MFESYLEMLKAVKDTGKRVPSANVSANRSLETKELNNVQVIMNDDVEYILNENEKKYLSLEMDWFMGRIKWEEKP